jgi:hypothetical protein
MGATWGAACAVDFDGLRAEECERDEECAPPGGAACIDARCDEGRCIVAVRSCDDGNPCTMDQCDVATDECVNAPLADGTECAANATCTGGECGCIEGFDNCDGEPGCEANLASDPKHCHRCDFECDPGQSCINSLCGSCADNDDCDDGRACTIDECISDGACDHTLEDDACLIAGQCRTALEVDPNNACRSCQPDASQGGWTDRRDGTPCDDDNPCAVCEGGECVEPQDVDDACCAPPHCRGALGECRLPTGTECLGTDGRCCMPGLLPGACDCIS